MPRRYLHVGFSTFTFLVVAVLCCKSAQAPKSSVIKICSALGSIIHDLRRDTQLCNWINCSRWELPDCVPEPMPGRAESLKSVLKQLQHVANNSRWGRPRTLAVAHPISQSWVAEQLLLAPSSKDQQPPRGQKSWKTVTGNHPQTDIVIARCLEPVAEWLPQLLVHLPAAARVRVFLYEMCSGAVLQTRRWAAPWAYWLDVPITRIALENRGFESAAYLHHITSALRADDVADTTLFLQAGWRDHSPKLLGCNWLETYIRSVPFVHYGSWYSTGAGNGCWDVCMAYHVWAVALPGHRILKSATASYAIFHAHRERIAARSLQDWEALIPIATMRSPELSHRLCGSKSLPICPGRGCQKRLHHEEGFASQRVYCNDSGKMAGLGLELAWHILLGEPDVLPMNKAPFSEVHLSFSPRPWRKPLGPPCSAAPTALHESSPSDRAAAALTSSRLMGVLLRLMSAGMQFGMTTTTLRTHAQRQALRFRLRSDLHKAADAKAHRLVYGSEEQALLAMLTSRPIINATSLSSLDEAHTDVPTGNNTTRHLWPASTAAVTGRVRPRLATRAPRLPEQPPVIAFPNASRPRKCCGWVSRAERQPRTSVCGDVDQLGPAGWWKRLRNGDNSHLVLRIRMNHASAGFFAYLLFALNQLAFAERHRMTPYVDFSECTVNGHDHYASGGRNLYFNSSRGPNMWEYFFEPVSNFRIGMPVYSLRALPSRMLWRLHHSHPASVYAYYYGKYSKKRGFDADWFCKMRRKAHRLIVKYVHPKRRVLLAVERFWQSHVPPNTPVLGVHLRGTDKLEEVAGSVIHPKHYVPHIDRYLLVHPNATIMAATDSPSFLRWLRDRYASRVVVRHVLRSERNAFLDPSINDAARKGEDVLIDALLLSRCDFLLKCSSAVGEFAIYFNPRLHNRSFDVQLHMHSATGGTIVGTDAKRSWGTAPGGQIARHEADAATTAASSTTPIRPTPSKEKILAEPCSRLQSVLSTLALNTDICSVYAKCSRRNLRCARQSQVSAAELRRLQEVYGAFRDTFKDAWHRNGPLPELSLQRGEDIEAAEAVASVSFIIRRCHEPVHAALAQLFLIFPALSRLQLHVHEACAGHAGKIVDFPLLDARDVFFRVQRYIVEDKRDSISEYRQWSREYNTRRHGIASEQAIFVHAKWLPVMLQPHIWQQVRHLFAQMAALPKASQGNHSFGTAAAMQWTAFNFSGAKAPASVQGSTKAAAIATKNTRFEQAAKHTMHQDGQQTPELAAIETHLLVLNLPAIDKDTGDAFEAEEGAFEAGHSTRTRVLRNSSLNSTQAVSQDLLRLLIAATFRAVSASRRGGPRHFVTPKTSTATMKLCPLRLTQLEPDFFTFNRELLQLQSAAFVANASGCMQRTNSVGTLDDIVSLRVRLEQHCGAKCAHQRTLSTRLIPAGWVSTFLGVIKPLSHAVRTNSTLQTPQIMAFTSPTTCPQRDLSCFFKQIFEACPPFSTGAPAMPNGTFLDLNNDQFVRSESPSSLKDPIAEPFRRRGWFWWTAQLLARVARPSPPLARALTLALEITGLGEVLRAGAPVLGLHVRHGDACSRREEKRMARTCAPLAEYMRHVDSMARRFGVVHIYLATDSAQIVAEAQEHTEYRILHLPEVSRSPKDAQKIGGLWDQRVAQWEAEGRTDLSQREAWLATLDMLLLAKCGFFVGKFTSSFFRAAYSIHSGHCDCAAPFISLDAPWCLDYGMRTGSNWEFPNHAAKSRLGRAPNRFWC